MNDGVHIILLWSLAFQRGVGFSGWGTLASIALVVISRRYRSNEQEGRIALERLDIMKLEMK